MVKPRVQAAIQSVPRKADESTPEHMRRVILSLLCGGEHESEGTAHLELKLAVVADVAAEGAARITEHHESVKRNAVPFAK
jgi:hypothetical protein